MLSLESTKLAGNKRVKLPNQPIVNFRISLYAERRDVMPERFPNKFVRHLPEFILFAALVTQISVSPSTKGAKKLVPE